MYSQGGIFSITSRILVVDFLSSTTGEDNRGASLIVRVTEPRDCYRSGSTPRGKVCIAWMNAVWISHLALG